MGKSGAYILALAVACALFSGTASAKTPTTDTLKIDVTASISERCGVQALGPRVKDGGRIDRATVLAFNFKLDCNMPFKIGVAAQNGALRLVSQNNAQSDPAGFSVMKKYNVGLSFMTDQDGLIDAGDCASEKLNASDPTCKFYGAQPGMGFSPGRQTTAIGREGALTISWDGEDAEPVRHAAGAYQETLTIVVAPRT